MQVRDPVATQLYAPEAAGTHQEPLSAQDTLRLNDGVQTVELQQHFACSVPCNWPSCVECPKCFLFVLAAEAYYAMVTWMFIAQKCNLLLKPVKSPFVVVHTCHAMQELEVAPDVRLSSRDSAAFHGAWRHHTVGAA